MTDEQSSRLHTVPRDGASGPYVDVFVCRSVGDRKFLESVRSVQGLNAFEATKTTRVD